MPTLEGIKISLTWGQITKIFSVVILVVGGYYKMLHDIEQARLEPPPPISREEYNLKYDLLAQRISFLEKELDRHEEELKLLKD